MNLIDVQKQFRTQEACNDFLEEMRWHDGVRCVQCDSVKVTKYIKAAGTRTRRNPKTDELELKPVPARILHVCLECARQFSVTEGTIFNDTHLPLEKWFAAVALMVNGKKGIAAKQMQRDLGVAYKTAWYLNHRIRKAMGICEVADEEPLSGVVEIDETYVGSKKYDKRRKRAKYQKEPVFGMVERGGGVKTHHVPVMNRHNIVGKIEATVSITVDAVYTDESNLYQRLPITSRSMR